MRGVLERILIRPLARFCVRREGATMVEFGLISTPFFLLLMGIIENGMIFVTQTNLDNALMETAREIRTGQVQKQSISATELTNSVCIEMGKFMIVSCGTNLYLDVQSFPNFESASVTPPVTDNQVDPAKITFDPGTPSEVVVVRAYYRWKLLTPMISAFMANLQGNERLLQSTVAFKNEPYLGVDS
jgi:Flp pilus assembly protein TadG